MDEGAQPGGEGVTPHQPSLAGRDPLPRGEEDRHRAAAAHHLLGVSASGPRQGEPHTVTLVTIRIHGLIVKFPEKYEPDNK